MSAEPRSTTWDEVITISACKKIMLSPEKLPVVWIIILNCKGATRYKNAPKFIKVTGALNTFISPCQSNLPKEECLHCHTASNHSSSREKIIPSFKLLARMQHTMKILKDFFASIPFEDSGFEKEINWRGWAGETKACYQLFIYPKLGASRPGMSKVPRNCLEAIQHITECPRHLKNWHKRYQQSPRAFFKFSLSD